VWGKGKRPSVHQNLALATSIPGFLSQGVLQVEHRLNRRSITAC
jgi:hypothetical protein